MSDYEKKHFPLLYFGPIEYYRLIAQSKNCLFVSNERFEKQTYRSRCQIYGANGKLTLTIPVNRPYGNKSLVNEVQLSNATPWKKNHWKSIMSAYGRAPYFDYYAPQLQAIYVKPHAMLLELLEEIQCLTHQWLAIEPCRIEEIAVTPVIQKSIDQSMITNRNDHQEYWQVFQDKHGFIRNLSILDLLFNEGPQGQMIVHR